MDTLLDRFVQAFEVWPEARPYLGLMVDDDEMRLVVALHQGHQPATVDEVAALLGLGREQAAALLERAFGRHVVDRVVEACRDEGEDGLAQRHEGQARYRASTFYHRLDHFAKFGAWDELPLEARRRLDRLYLDEFIARHRASVGKMMAGQAPDQAPPNDALLLLPEVDEMLDAARDIIVQPCDCRRLGQFCTRPVETCLWLDDLALGALERGYGRRLTREEAKEVARRADRAGLMHTGDASWRENGLHAICNCCACDCYPFRAAQELGSKGIWPRSRYIAAHDPALCSQCGACVKRCHFAAFYHDGTTVEIDGKERRAVRLDPARCWGCGLCANTCPAGAVVMEPLA